MQWIKRFYRRTVYACGCGFRTRDFYRNSMHRTMKGHTLGQELESADWPRWFGSVLVLVFVAGLLFGIYL